MSFIFYDFDGSGNECRGLVPDRWCKANLVGYPDYANYWIFNAMAV